MVVLTSTICFAETFFWEDKKGIHMTDDVLKLPPKFRDKYEKYIKQNPKQESKEIQTTKMEKVLENAIPESARNAVRALKKLEARTEAGMSYRDYSPALGDAKFEVNMFIESKEANNFSDMKSSIIKAMNYYDNAKYFWSINIISYGGRGYFPKGDKVYSEYFNLYPETNKSTDVGGVLLSADAIFVGAAISHIFSLASKEVANSFAMINK